MASATANFVLSMMPRDLRGYSLPYSPFCISNFKVPTDVSAGSSDLDNDALISLAHRYPKLKKITLRETCYIGSPGIITLFQNCPDLRYIEITRGISAEQCITATAFNQLRRHPDWAP
jgi:hypothetical protein